MYEPLCTNLFCAGVVVQLCSTLVVLGLYYFSLYVRCDLPRSASMCVYGWLSACSLVTASTPDAMMQVAGPGRL